MNIFWLANFPVNDILTVHIGNLNAYLVRRGMTFESIWLTYNSTGTTMMPDMDRHIQNLTLTYGKDCIDTWLKKNTKKTA